MEDMEILSQLIRTAALVPLQDEYGKLFVKLNEPQIPDSFATIRNLPSDAMVVKVDSFRSPDDIFNGGNGECKRADYVIISAEKKCILMETAKLKKFAQFARRSLLEQVSAKLKLVLAENSAARRESAEAIKQSKRRSRATARNRSSSGWPTSGSTASAPCASWT
jgi:hypothetical protein